MISFIGVSCIVYSIGVAGLVLNRKDVIIVLICIELMLVGVNMNFLVCSVYLDDLVGQVMGLFILMVAGGESAIGLGIVVVYYRVRGSIDVANMSVMQGWETDW